MTFERVIWSLAGGAIVVAAIASTLGPIGGDQTCFAYAAWRLLEGDRPGIELWELKPPLHVYYYATFFRLLGTTELALLAGDVCLQLLAMSSFAWGATRAGAARLGITTSAAYGLLYFIVMPHADHGEVEALANGLTLAGCGVLLLLGRSSPAYGVAGFLFGMTFWTKIFPPGFGILFALLTLVAAEGAVWRRTASLAVGVVLGIGAWWVVWQGSGDGFQVLRDVADARRFQAQAQDPSDPLRVLRLLLAYGAGWATVTAVLASGVEWSRVLAGRIGGTSVLAWLALVGTWVLLSLSIVVVQGQYFGYHFMHLLLPMSLLTGICHAARRRDVSTGVRIRRRTAAAVAAALLAGLFVFRDQRVIGTAVRIGWGATALANLGHLSAALRTGDLESHRNWVAAQEVEENPRSVRIEVGRAVSRLSAPGERILFLDGGATAFWARRPSYLRYFSPLPIQRVRSNPRLAHSPLSEEVGAKIRRFDGSVVVWDPLWLPAGLSGDVDALLSQFQIAERIAPYEVLVRPRGRPS